MVELFTSTGEGFTFDSMIARFSFAPTGKCNSMIELFTSTGKGFDSTGEGFDSTIARFSFASTGKCNSMVELFTSMGKGFDSTIKFNASTGEQYSESTTPQRAKNIVNQRADMTQWSNYLPQRAEILSQRSQRVNSTGKE